MTPHHLQGASWKNWKSFYSVLDAMSIYGDTSLPVKTHGKGDIA